MLYDGDVEIVERREGELIKENAVNITIGNLGRYWLHFRWKDSNGTDCILSLAISKGPKLTLASLRTRDSS